MRKRLENPLPDFSNREDVLRWWTTYQFNATQNFLDVIQRGKGKPMRFKRYEALAPKNEPRDPGLSHSGN